MLRQGVNGATSPCYHQTMDKPAPPTNPQRLRQIALVFSNCLSRTRNCANPTPNSLIPNPFPKIGFVFANDPNHLTPLQGKFP